MAAFVKLEFIKESGSVYPGSEGPFEYNVRDRLQEGWTLVHLTTAETAMREQLEGIAYFTRPIQETSA